MSQIAASKKYICMSTYSKGNKPLSKNKQKYSQLPQKMILENPCSLIQILNFLAIPYSLAQVWTSTDFYRNAIVIKLVLLRRERERAIFMIKLLKSFLSMLNIIIKSRFAKVNFRDTHRLICKKLKLFVYVIVFSCRVFPNNMTGYTL